MARESSVNRAAKVLHASQPAVSRRIRQLEHDVGARLFVRRSTGMALTPAGRAFVRYSDELRRLSDEARTVVRQFSGKRKNELRIGFYQPAATVLAPMIHWLRHEHPEITVVPVELVPAALIEALREGRVDVALPGYAQRQLLSEFEGIRIPSAALTFVLPSGHKFADRKILNLAEMKGEKIVAMHEDEFPGCHSLIVEMCRQAGFSPEIFAYAHSMTEAVAYVMTGECTTLLPESAIAIPLSSDVVLVRCDAREDWFALWSSSNGKPELRAVVDALHGSSPAGWVHRQRAPQVFPGVADGEGASARPKRAAFNRSHAGRGTTKLKEPASP